jgi:hypothetical protein
MDLEVVQLGEGFAAEATLVVADACVEPGVALDVALGLERLRTEGALVLAGGVVDAADVDFDRVFVEECLAAQLTQL